MTATPRPNVVTKNATPEPLPRARQYVRSPLRNRIRVRLNATPAKVWALIGDLPKYPEYSSGMDHVDATLDPRGRCTEYVCHFKPTQPGVPGLVHREYVKWYEPNRGYASTPETPNEFGLEDTLTLITLEPDGTTTRLTWDEYFQAQDLRTNKKVFDEALADIADNLVRRFGGQTLERYKEPDEAAQPGRRSP